MSNMIRRMQRFLALGAVGGTAMLMGTSGGGCSETLDAFVDGFNEGYEGATSQTTEPAYDGEWSTDDEGFWGGLF